MNRSQLYRALALLTMLLCFTVGVVLLRLFVVYLLFPLAMRLGPPPIDTNYWGLYMAGFAGALLLAWGACLVAAVRAPETARTVGTATAFGLVVNGVFRMVAWFSGEYAEVGNLPRVEAAAMLFLALGFVWLRPPRTVAGRWPVGRWAAAVICLALLALDATLDRRFRGSAEVRDDVPRAAARVGEPLPEFTLPDIDGHPVSLAEARRGGRALVTFERSLDW